MKNARWLGSSLVAALVSAAIVACSAAANQDPVGGTSAGGASASSTSATATGGQGGGGGSSSMSASSAGGSLLEDGGLVGPCGEAPPTRIKGSVYAPNAIDPLYRVLVYVPASEVEPFKDGVECIQCGEASGDPIVSTTTDTKGEFVLENGPCGDDVPLVMQLGKWRRQITIPHVECCADTDLVDHEVTRLPKNQSEGDMPRMALVTGQIDALECAFRKMGVDDSEFTLPASMGGTGHIQFYAGNGAAGATVVGGPPPLEDELWSDDATLAQYDMVLFPCQGSPYPRTPEAEQNMIEYANAGGRVFTTHYSYVWIHDNIWSTSGDWSMVDPGYGPPDLNGVVNTSFPEGQALADWLYNIGASMQNGLIPVKDVRHDISVVNASTTREWIDADPAISPNNVLHMTFDTPIGADPEMQCGRVLFEDFHVEEADLDYAQVFPQNCIPGPMTPQEKLLEFMLFDLASCVGPVRPPE